MIQNINGRPFSSEKRLYERKRSSYHCKHFLSKGLRRIGGGRKRARNILLPGTVCEEGDVYSLREGLRLGPNRQLAKHDDRSGVDGNDRQARIVQEPAL